MGKKTFFSWNIVIAAPREFVFNFLTDFDNNVKWVFLLSDILVKKFYPEYLIENIRKDFVKGDLKREIAIWQGRRNYEKKKINWTFTIEKADKKLGKYYIWKLICHYTIILN